MRRIADRTFGIEVDQLCLLIHAACRLRHTLGGLEPTSGWRADTIGLALIKVAARVTEVKTRIEVMLPICDPDQQSRALFASRAVKLPPCPKGQHAPVEPAPAIPSLCHRCRPDLRPQPSRHRPGSDACPVDIGKRAGRAFRDMIEHDVARCGPEIGGLTFETERADPGREGRFRCEGHLVFQTNANVRRARRDGGRAGAEGAEEAGDRKAKISRSHIDVPFQSGWDLSLAVAPITTMANPTLHKDVLNVSIVAVVLLMGNT